MNLFTLKNRRYVGSKLKISTWIEGLITENCQGNSFFDAFAGTAIVAEKMLPHFHKIIINDFLYSNFVIYQGFFGKSPFSTEKVNKIARIYQNQENKHLPQNYFDENFGGKFFSAHDARLIGNIREDLNLKLDQGEINQREFHILLSSLLYSADKCANTVGHYDAYIQNKSIQNKFSFGQILPLHVNENEIEIFREDTNTLSKKIQVDVAFIDPPYNSRQYSRFYHVLENLAEWKKPQLFGVALKPSAENMSDYCRNNARIVFFDLIANSKAKYLAVTYNNTYSSKSSSSKNKMTLEEIHDTLQEKGKTQVFSKEHPFFNAGKTNFSNHLEYLFITRVI